MKLLPQTVQGPGRARLQPGATVSSVAISHGINTNVIRKGLPIYRDKTPASQPAFVPLQPMPKRTLMKRRLSHCRCLADLRKTYSPYLTTAAAWDRLDSLIFSDLIMEGTHGIESTPTTIGD